MAPHTRRSHPKAPADGTHGKENETVVPLQSSTLANTKIRGRVAARRVMPEAQTHTSQQVLGKRTYAPTQTPSNAQTSTSQSIEPTKPTKKARNVGPAHGRPIPFLLPGRNEVEGGEIASTNGDLAIQQHKSDSAVKGKRVDLERTSSFYPGRGDNNHPLAHIDHAIFPFRAPQVDDEGSETEESDDDTADVSIKQPSKFSESLAIERPTWGGSGASEPDNSGNHGVRGDGFVRPTGNGQETTSGSTVPDAELSDEIIVFGAHATVTWPADTDLVLAAGSSKLSLLAQRPIVRAVIQEAIDNLRAALVFTNAFPDVCNALTLIKDCLLDAALRLKPGATEMLERLKHDQDYVLKITPLPRARICLIRSEIKERCNHITSGVFMLFGSALDIVDYVAKQLSRYTYTFPRAGLHNAPTHLVMRTRPYRNDRIINVIRDMFFAGGATSFARRFRFLFPTFEGRNGDEKMEVPIAMVALVATALYAALYEWRTGEYHVAEFSTNTYLDVYQGHVNTLKHIRDNRPGAFHLMMADIYAQANTASDANEPVPTVVIADLDLDDLEDLEG